jgi:DNA-nicking Smr family endonuclease
MKTRSHRDTKITTPICRFAPFKGLKGILESRQFSISAEKIAVKKSDDEIFRDAMADVREIREFRELPLKSPPRFDKMHPVKDDSLEILQQIVNGERKITLADTSEYMEWIRPNVRKDIIRRLHNGDFSVQDSIDLHGMTLGVAEEAFSAFFREALKKHLFCIKVIHGRGLRSPHGPVLKEALKKWLRGAFSRWVLAYVTAKDCDGGLGATYIILK